MTKWNRRRFLKAAGISASAAALLPFFPVPRAEALAGPKRLIMVAHGQGTDMSRWRCTGSEEDFELGYILKPFEDYKSNLLVLDGVDNEASYHGRFSYGAGHFGMASMFTGVVCPRGNLRSEKVGWPQAPSIDRIVAERIGKDTPFDAYYWGTWPAAQDGGNQGPNGLAFYRGADQPIDPVLTPDRAFDQLFAGVTGNSEEVAKLRLEQKSVLDLIRGEIKRLRPELPAIDRERFDVHLDGIRTLEERLVDLKGMCIVPMRPRDFSDGDKRNFRMHAEITKAQFQLMAHAMACDLTRVACFLWPHSEGSGRFMEEEGYDSNFGSFHTVAHTMNYGEVLGSASGVSEEGRRQARKNMANLNQWRSKMLKEHLLDKLLPEVRDQTVMMWASEMSEGGTHSNRNVPIVLFQGDTVGHFKTGRYLKYGAHDPMDVSKAQKAHGGAKMNKVLVSVCNAMGLKDVNEVGNPEFGKGPLENLT